MLTENKFLPYKGDFKVYEKYTVEDEYKSKAASYDDEHTYTVHNIMITPLSDKEVIELYGIKAVGMKQFILYTDENINYGDRLQIGNSLYEIVQILQYQTHRLIVMAKV